MRYIIDRFESKYAICEDEEKKMHQIPKYRMPLGAKEGDSIIEEDGIIVIDKDSTADRQARIRKKLEKLF